MKRIFTLIGFMSVWCMQAKAQYCVPTSTQCFENITNVTLNTINNTSLSSCGITSNGFSDYTAISTNLNAGQAYTISVTGTQIYPNDTIDIWIDYDHNTTFDNSEYVAKLYGFMNGGTGSGIVSGSITIPVTAPTGSTRMRVRMRDGFSNNTPSACGAQQYGEAEDYIVNITGVANCTGTPSALTITNSSPVYVCPSNTTTLTATDGNTGAGITYQWQSSSSSTGPWSNVTGGTGATTLSYTTPTVAGTVYYTVRAKCTATSLQSPNSNVVAVMPATLPTITANPASSSICAGGSTLMAVTATGSNLSYQWQVNDGTGYTNITNNATYSGATTTVLNVTNAAATMSGYSYRAIVTANECSPSTNSAAATLTVRSAPSITFPPASHYVCPGGNTAFTVIASGSPVLTYQWQVSTGATYSNVVNNAIYSGATSATLNLTGVTSTMNGYKYRCLVTGPCNPSATSASATLNIGLTPPALSISGDTTFCDGGAVYLTAPSGYTYQWYSGTSMIPFANDSVFAATTTGFYHVVISSGVSCSGTSSSVNVTVLPTPEPPFVSAAGNVQFCLGSGVTLSASTDPSLPAQWLLNNGTILGATGDSYNATDSGFYSVQVTGANGCTSTSNTIQTFIYVLPMPVLAQVPGDSLCVSNAASFTTFHWYLNGQPIPGVTSSCYQATVSGSYSVEGVDENSCSKMSYPTDMSHVSVSTLPSASNGIRIYPNPATNTIKVEAPFKVGISISSLDGRIVYSEKNVNAMDISDLATGVYMVTVYDEHNTVLKIEKLVKE